MAQKFRDDVQPLAYEGMTAKVWDPKEFHSTDFLDPAICVEIGCNELWLDIDEAKALRDWLNKTLPDNATNPARVSDSAATVAAIHSHFGGDDIVESAPGTYRAEPAKNPDDV